MDTAAQAARTEEVAEATSSNGAEAANDVHEVDEAAGLAETGQSLWRNLQAMAYEHLHLAALEAQRAARSLGAVLAASIALGVLIASSTLLLIAALVLGLLELGVPPSIAAFLAALLSLTACTGLAASIRIRSRLLGFPASLRSIKPEANSSPDPGAAK